MVVTSIFTFGIVYDTLERVSHADSLVISPDEKASRISSDEYIDAELISGGQDMTRLSTRFAIRGNRLYVVKDNRRLVRGRYPGIWPKRIIFNIKKTWPAYYRRQKD